MIAANDDGDDRLAAIHDQLLNAVDRLVISDAWRTMLTVAARLPRYSPNNVLLITSQRPDATWIAGHGAWSQLGRQVRKGERGIAILAPVLRRHRETGPSDTVPPAAIAAPDAARGRLAGFRVAHVFDVSQTDGPDLAALRPTLLEGAGPLELWADLLEQVDIAGYDFGYADLAPANGLTDFSDNTVLIRPDLSPAQQSKTLAHELAHVRLHAPDVRPAGLLRDQAEVEAESVAYVVTAAHGLVTDEYTVPYVTGRAGGDREQIAAAATRVLGCARSILHHRSAASTVAEPAQANPAVSRPPVELAKDRDLTTERSPR
jgi:hypothetical protein